jgi:hypothetical protein
MRALYEGYAEALASYLHMPLPPWIAEQPHKDNWLAVARLRAQTEAADSRSVEEKVVDAPQQAISAPMDDRHEF